MDNRIKIIESTLDDAIQLAPHLRVDDINELKALKVEPLSALLRGYIYGDECYSVWANNEVIGMYGVSNWELPKGFASIWFLGSDECKKYPMAFVKQGIKYVKESLEKYDILCNCVDARNTSHVKWLKTIGMNFASSLVVNGVEFIQFYKVKGV